MDFTGEGESMDLTWKGECELDGIKEIVDWSWEGRVWNGWGKHRLDK